MKPFRAVFQIIDNNNCPLYESEEVFVLSEKSLAFPEGKESCLILVRELTQLLFELFDNTGDPDLGKKYTCSGCTGLIKFQQVVDEADLQINEQLLSEKEQRLFENIRRYSLLQAIPSVHLKKCIRCFRVRIVGENELLITKGQLNEHLYILLSGEVMVEDGEVPITRLAEGELCGEMTYFGNSIASTSVRALTETRVLAISGKDFSRLIKRSENVQMHMARLLAERLSRANSMRVSNFESCMQGRLNEMAPAELLQVFHMHQKTGVLNFELPRGNGRVSFREGSIVKADYAGLADQEAVFAILAEKEGIYSFTSGLPEREMQQSSIGDFMMLLMEGVKREDEK